MEAVERCRFCREPLNEGAVACAACGRRQAGGGRAQAVAWMVAAVLVVFVVWVVVVAPAREDRDRERRAECAVTGC